MSITLPPQIRASTQSVEISIARSGVFAVPSKIYFPGISPSSLPTPVTESIRVALTSFSDLVIEPITSGVTFAPKIIMTNS